ncbi:MAG: phosphatidylserine/phosphatidylglycerophosphate/cardiolipin synthase family protein [Myxococcales bacterium]|nr:phosphatidylserine/phosphatidylglycerophosphate/cardiolipin synthase family protein [Myxococcales bacterium]
MSARAAWLALGALALAACGGDPSGDGDAGVDAATDGPACDPDRARTAAPTVVIGPAALEDSVVALIDGAAGSIDVQMYSFTLTRIADRLIAADRRGVPVRVLLDGGQPENASIRTRLTGGGVEVRNAPAAFINAHAKYLVVDGARAFIESGNFTVAGMSDQRNYAVDDRDPVDVADLATIFAADWGGTTATLTCTRLVVTPGDSRLRIQTLIASATTSLDLALYYLSDSAIRAALLTAHNRGVAVRVLLAATSEIAENAAIATTLSQAGIPVRTLANPTMHAKVIIADNAAALIGSNNMSITSMRDNREVGVIVREPSAVTPTRTQFAADWAAATPW